MEPTQNQEDVILPTEGESVINESVKKEEVSTVELPDIDMVPSTTPERTITVPVFSTKKLFYVCLGLFIVSSLGVLINILAITMYLWFIAVGLSLISVIVLFFAGVYQGIFTKKTFKLVGVSIVFLVVLSLVGAGTCYVNMMGMSGF